MSNLLGELQQQATKIRDGLFLAPSRSYGEQYIEPFIRQMYSLDQPDGGDYDAIDQQGSRYEIKSCKVLAKNLEVSKKEPLIERILAENYNIMTNRLILFEDRENTDYMANVQNVKRDHFDFLIYVLLFEDCIKIFRVETAKINLSTIPNWSDKHGRYDALGKSGQFPITRRNISHHLDNYLIDTVEYSQVAEIYRSLSR